MVEFGGNEVLELIPRSATQKIPLVSVQVPSFPLHPLFLPCALLYQGFLLVLL